MTTVGTDTAGIRTVGVRTGGGRTGGGGVGIDKDLDRRDNDTGDEGTVKGG